MSEIPDGWVALSSYDGRADKTSGGPKGDYQRLIKAVNTKRISSMRIRGVASQLVRRDEAESYLKKCEESRNATPKRRGEKSNDAAETQMAWMRVLVHGLLERTERIAVALENLATTPKATEGQHDATH